MYRFSFGTFSTISEMTTGCYSTTDLGFKQAFTLLQGIVIFFIASVFTEIPS